jgi:hypothetical protein
MGERSDSMELSGFKSPKAVSRQPLSREIANATGSFRLERREYNSL